MLSYQKKLCVAFVVSPEFALFKLSGISPYLDHKGLFDKED